MAIPAREEERSAGRGRLQVSLADLCCLVLAAALGVSLSRGARDVGGMRPTGWIALPFARTAGVGLSVAAIWLAIVVARRMLTILTGRGRLGTAAPRLHLMAALAWRCAALALLLGFALRESWILRVDYATFDARAQSEVGWASWYELREELTPICTILVMLGLLLGMGAGRALGQSDPRRRRPYWLIVPLSAVVGLLLMAIPNAWWSIITQLVLLALEAVHNAMPPPHRAGRDGLSVRLLRAGIESIPAAIAGLWLALVVAHDFERQRRNETWATSRRGWAFRLISLGIAVVSGAFVVLVAIPTVSPHWLDGFRKVLEPEVILMVLAGFGVFAAGLAARTLVPMPIGETSGWKTRLPDVVVPAGLLTIVLLAALQCLPSSTQLDSGVPAIVGRLCDLAREIPAWLRDRVPDHIEARLSRWFGPEPLVWMLAMAAVGLLILELILSRQPGDPPVPFDEVARTPGGLARFLWLTAGLTTVCLVALPTLTLLGQVIVHARLHIDNWLADGWPSPF